MIAGRDLTRLLDGLERQIIAVRHALTRIGCDAVPTPGLMCFTEVDLPLNGTLQIRGHEMHHPERLAKRLTARGPVEPDVIRMLAGELAAAGVIRRRGQFPGEQYRRSPSSPRRCPVPLLPEPRSRTRRA